MKISNPERLKQALASINLESLPLAPEVEKLLTKALTDPSIDTEDIKQLLLSPYTKGSKP